MKPARDPEKRIGNIRLFFLALMVVGAVPIGVTELVAKSLKDATWLDPVSYSVQSAVEVITILVLIPVGIAVFAALTLIERRVVGVVDSSKKARKAERWEPVVLIVYLLSVSLIGLFVFLAVRAVVADSTG